MKNGTTIKRRDDAVSPVIGVMLMLVVTIIIAAVVSMFAGGLVGDAKKAPAMTADVSIQNTGSYATSQFLISVLSVSEPISTADLKIVTRWTSTNKTIVDVAKGTTDGSPITGGATVTSAKPNVQRWTVGDMDNLSTAPWGYGYGVESVNTGAPNKWAQQFGNYTIQGGTVMRAMPAGATGGFFNGVSPDGGYGLEKTFYYDSKWDYDTGYIDGMQAVLGRGWENLRVGDIVHVQLIHTASGHTILEKDVAVS